MRGLGGPALVALVLLATAVACASPTPPPPPPDQVVDRAAKKLVDTQSLHFVIEFTGGPTYLDKAHTLTLRRVEGDIVRPDRMRANVKAALPGAYIQVQAIGIGDDQYATNPLNGQWQKIPTEWGFNPALLFQSEKGLAAMLSHLQNLSTLPDETIENQRHYHVAGEMPADQIAPLTGWLIGTEAVRFDLWVGADDSYTRRIRLVERAAAGAPAGSTPVPPAQWNMELSKFDVPVTILPPPL